MAAHIATCCGCSTGMTKQPKGWVFQSVVQLCFLYFSTSSTCPSKVSFSSYTNKLPLHVDIAYHLASMYLQLIRCLQNVWHLLQALCYILHPPLSSSFNYSTMGIKSGPWYAVTVVPLQLSCIRLSFSKLQLIARITPLTTGRSTQILNEHEWQLVTEDTFGVNQA